MKITFWRVAVLACALVAAHTPRAAAQFILMDDIDDWDARIFAGAPGVRNYIPGAADSGGVSGIMAFDSRDNAYLASGNVILKITPDGRSSILTGMQDLGGNTDGPPGQATFGNAMDIVLVNDDLMYVVDAANLTLRRLTKRGGVWHTETVAGVPGVNGHRDGPGSQALFTTPFESLTADENGVIYLMDGDWLRKFENGEIITLNAGSGYSNGPLEEARFLRSQGRQHGLTYDGKGNLYVADKLSAAIRKVDLRQGVVTTISGLQPDDKRDRSRDGPALDARYHPSGGPNMIFYHPIMDALILRSDDESGIRIIRDGWTKSFGPDYKRNTALEGPWRSVVGGLPCGIDRHGRVYVMGNNCIRVVEKTRGAPLAANIAPGLSLGPEQRPPSNDGTIPTRHPAAAFGADQFLLAWQEGFGGPDTGSAIKLMRLNADVRPLEGTAFSVNGKSTWQETPAVAFAANRFLVVWADMRNGRDFDIYGAFVSTNIKSSSAKPFLIAGGSGAQCRPSVATDGTNQFLVVWQGKVDDHHEIFALRLDARTGKPLDPGPRAIMPRGERPVASWNGDSFMIAQKWYAVLMDPDGTIASDVTQTWNSKTCGFNSAASAWGRHFNFFDTEPLPDPWGWGGGGALVGVSLRKGDLSPERSAAARFRNLQAAEADGRLDNVVDATRWRNHPGWPMGMIGALKSSHDGLWISGRPAAAFNGRSLLCVWPRARMTDHRRLRDRDLYVTRLLPDWGKVETLPQKLVSSPAEESNPVLTAGRIGETLLAYETAGPSGVSIAYRMLREEPDTQPLRATLARLVSTNVLAVTFNKALISAQVEAPNAFQIDGVRITSATVNKDATTIQREVLLTTADLLAPGRSYTLKMRHLTDRNSPPNAIEATPFTFTPPPGQIQRGEFIQNWAMLGPFDRDSNKHPIDPAKLAAYDPAATVHGSRWVQAKGPVVGVHKEFGQKELMAYLVVYVHSTLPRKALLRLDTNDNNRAWLNGQLVHDGISSATGTRGFHSYTDEIPIELNEGWNRCVLQVDNILNQCLAIGQITDFANNALRDLTWQIKAPTN